MTLTGVLRTSNKYQVSGLPEWLVSMTGAIIAAWRGDSCRFLQNGMCCHSK